ncbi:polyprenyl synthetase family protein [Comamonas aquatica]|nr:farnesyl diphosphate synthase [Comamonas aquatica]MDH1380246.1 polyprenyl synthetase family protein [Comamonas aquatica]MDH1640267.1 polyprenyl synthetase family protein [Comamonas aquatica]
MEAQLHHVEQALSQWVGVDTPADLGDAMRYAVLDGGKRLRPLLVLAAAQAVQGLPQAATRAACAVELIHAYSLVHDDMPCMDNDVLRRGKPTAHVQFGEARALLAGDALQVLAFELLTPADAQVPASMQAQLCRLLARAAGAHGMAGGQAIDLASVGQSLTEAQLRRMHSLKTGALLEASVAMGMACGSVSDAAQQALMRYAQLLGLAFQVVDDVLDVVADAATLGKTPGKDADNDKPTYVSLMGLESARAYAQSLYQQSLQALAGSGLQNVQALSALAHMVVGRSN